MNTLKLSWIKSRDSRPRRALQMACYCLVEIFISILFPIVIKSIRFRLDIFNYQAHKKFIFYLLPSHWNNKNYSSFLYLAHSVLIILVCLVSSAFLLWLNLYNKYSFGWKFRTTIIQKLELCSNIALWQNFTRDNCFYLIIIFVLRKRFFIWSLDQACVAHFKKQKMSIRTAKKIYLLKK